MIDTKHKYWLPWFVFWLFSSIESGGSMRNSFFDCSEGFLFTKIRLFCWMFKASWKLWGAVEIWEEYPGAILKDSTKEQDFPLERRYSSEVGRQRLLIVSLSSSWPLLLCDTVIEPGSSTKVIVESRFFNGAWSRRGWWEENMLSSISSNHCFMVFCKIHVDFLWDWYVNDIKVPIS